VPSPLLTRDGRYLATPRQPAWLRRLLVWSPLLAAALVLTVDATTAPDPVCTDATPCAADPFGSVVLGLFIASAVVGLVHAGTAAGLALAFATAEFGYDAVHPETASTWWVHALMIGYIALCLAVARALRPRHGYDVAFDWLARTSYDTPPGPRRLPGTDRRTLLLVAAALAAALLFLAWSVDRQTRADAQQAAAQPVVAEVVGHIDQYTLRVRLPDGQRVPLPVLNTAEHPVGGRIAVRVDAAGLRQPVSEPYDASGWLLISVVLAGLAIAVLARSRRDQACARQLFEEAQPVCAVYVCETWDRLAVYPADARPGEPAVAEIRLWRDPGAPPPAALVEATIDAEDSEDASAPAPRPALLYGVPAPGQWCTVSIDGEVRLPRRPLRAHFVAPPFSPPGLSVDDPVGVDLPLRPEELASLAVYDRDDDPFTLRGHAGHPSTAYLRIAVLALGLVALGRLLPAMSFPIALVGCALVVALAAEAGWRLWLRPRVAWNGGGLAVVGLLGARRLAWSDVHYIAAERGAVIVAGRDAALIVPASAGWLPLRTGTHPIRRDADQLALALRYARQQALSSGTAAMLAPPPLAQPRRPGSLGTLWLLLTIALATALHLAG
jgi:hypothetical protein